MPRPHGRAHDDAMTTPGEARAVSPGRRHVAVAIAYPSMHRLVANLLDRDHDRWIVSAIDDVSDLGSTVSAHPDLVIVDTADFAACCRRLPASFPPGRVIVIGPEPDPAYRHAALHSGAGAWLSRDCVAEELCDAMCSTAGRAQMQYPPSTEQPTNRPDPVQGATSR